MRRRYLLHLFNSIGLVALGVGIVYNSYAIGPIVGSGMNPTRYAANKFPLVYQTDRGSLGLFDNVKATELATAGFDTWENLATAAVSFSYAGRIDHDVTQSTDPLISGPTQFTDGVIPVVFDDNGQIIDDVIGAGASNNIYGYATSFTADGVNYQEGLAVINGVLTSREDVEPVYREVIAHELGHLLGAGHTQVGVGAIFTLMYPATLTNINNLGLDPDDAASMSVIYPAQGYLPTVGSIEGTITDAGGEPVSGVNVVAVNLDDGSSFSMLSDYYSGDDPRFTMQPEKTGYYRIDGLPPGRYGVRIEPVKEQFSTGSRVGSYVNPINTGIYNDWYSGQDESGEMLLDNSNEITDVTVSADAVTSDIDIVINDSPTLSTMTAFNGVIGNVLDLPMSLSNATIEKYAQRYEAPLNGSLVGVKLMIRPESDMPRASSLRVAVHENSGGSLAGVPGNELGAVSIPVSQLSADQENFVYLRGLGTAINFVEDEKFHVSLELEGEGSLALEFDDALGTQNETSYILTETSQWANFPDGLTGGAEGWNLRMTAVWSTVSAGVPTPLININPGQINFGTQRVGNTAVREITVRNVGTADLNVTDMNFTGGATNLFSIESGGAPFSLEPGKSQVVEVGFTPEAREQVSVNLKIDHNAGGGSTIVGMSGTGKAPDMRNVRDAYDFGEVPVDSLVEREFALFTNLGNDSLRVQGLDIESPDGFFLTSFDGPAWVPPGITFRVRVSFRPDAVRSHNSTLVVNHELDSSPLVVALSGSGTENTGSVSELRSGALSLTIDRVEPNPTEGYAEIGVSTRGAGVIPVEVGVFDAAGRRVSRFDRQIASGGGESEHVIPLDLSHGPSGTYFVRVQSGSRSIVARIVRR